LSRVASARSPCLRGPEDTRSLGRVEKRSVKIRQSAEWRHRAGAVIGCAHRTSIVFDSPLGRAYIPAAERRNIVAALSSAETFKK
jgi:hypothetical protein